MQMSDNFTTVLIKIYLIIFECVIINIYKQAK